MDYGGFVYMLASGKHGTLYVGVTARFAERIYEHREHLMDSFTARHKVTRLVWYEQHATIELAIAREKQIKHWKRDWKINRIEIDNPHWDDLAVGLFGYQPTGIRHPREGGGP